MKHLKLKYYLIMVSLVFLNKINAQDSLAKFKCYNISNTYFINYFSIIKPNLAIVPCKGGIYCPNLKAWYFKTNDTILSAEPSYIDTSLIITLTSRNLFEIEKIFTDTNKKIKPLVLTKGYVFYSAPSNFKKDLYFYVVGDSKGFNVCKLYKHKVDTIFRSDTLIEQLQVINDTAILYSIGNKIKCYLLAGKSYSIFNAGEDTIHGFTMDNNDNLYVSLDIGILKISKQKKRTLIINKIVKGKLRFLNKTLYILDTDHEMLDIVSPL